MNTLIERLSKDFPDLRFRAGRKFAFRPPRTVLVGPETGVGDEQIIYTMRLLHEVGHAILGHKNYTTDVERVKMEVAAWAKAEELAERYEVRWEEEVAQAELDSYRDWLHQRSKCPGCGLSRYQDEQGRYRCPRCDDL